MSTDKVTTLLKSAEFSSVCLAAIIMVTWPVERVIEIFESCSFGGTALTTEAFHLTKKLINSDGPCFLIVTKEWKILNNGAYLFLTSGDNSTWMDYWIKICNQRYIEI